MQDDPGDVQPPAGTQRVVFVKSPFAGISDSSSDSEEGKWDSHPSEGIPPHQIVPSAPSQTAVHDAQMMQAKSNSLRDAINIHEVSAQPVYAQQVGSACGLPRTSSSDEHLREAQLEREAKERAQDEVDALRLRIERMATELKASSSGQPVGLMRQKSSAVAKAEAERLARENEALRAEQARQEVKEQEIARQLEETQRLLKAELASRRRESGPQNIKQRLDNDEWGGIGSATEPLGIGQWWQTGTDCRAEVNKLRTVARVRAALPEVTEKMHENWRWPQLVVLGDGNTGKSSVLCRFAQFDFSAISDGVCTRRPVRLQLRPMSTTNRKRIYNPEEPLKAICTLQDYRDAEGDSTIKKEIERLQSQLSGLTQTSTQGLELSTKPAGKAADKAVKKEAKHQAKVHQQQDKIKAKIRAETQKLQGQQVTFEKEFLIRQDKQYAIDDEQALRFEVENRASASPPKRTKHMTAVEQHDGQYIMGELVITIEADHMIFFDLVDLPGLENGSEMTKALVQQYINPETANHTFMLLFQSADRGGTQMEYSMCYDRIIQIQKGNGQDWIDSHCMGVLTKIDKSGKLEKFMKLSASEGLAKVRKWLCDELSQDSKPEHMLKFDWVAVLNPNPSEQENHMGFHDAVKKEKWFFDEVFKGHTHHPAYGRCGIAGFRSLLVSKYAKLTAEFVRSGLGKSVFAAALNEERKIRQLWGWTVGEEDVHRSDVMAQVVERAFDRLLRDSMTFDPAAVMSQDSKYTRCFAECLRLQSDPKHCKKDLMKPIGQLESDIRASFRAVLNQPEYLRFTKLAEQLEAALNALLATAKEHAQRVCTTEIDRAAALRSVHGKSEASARGNISVAGVVYAMEQQLLQLAELSKAMPDIPTWLLKQPHEMKPELQHAGLHTCLLRKRATTRSDPAGFGFELTGNQKIRLHQDSSASVGILLQPEPEPEEGAGQFALTGSARVQTSTAVVAEECSFDGSTLMEVNGQSIGLKGVTKLVAQLTKDAPVGTLVSFKYVASSHLIKLDLESLESKSAMCTHFLHPLYKDARTIFMHRRRAAELLRLVFDDETKDIKERREFDSSVSFTRPLVHHKLSFSDLQKGDHNGTMTGLPVLTAELAFEPEPEPEPEPYSGSGHRSQQLGTATVPIELAGQCCQVGCYEPMDGACEPCGHTLFCMPCLQQHFDASGTCPVCAAAITGCVLCFDECSLRDLEGKVEKNCRDHKWRFQCRVEQSTALRKDAKGSSKIGRLEKGQDLSVSGVQIKGSRVRLKVKTEDGRQGWADFASKVGEVRMTACVGPLHDRRGGHDGAASFEVDGDDLGTAI